MSARDLRQSEAFSLEQAVSLAWLAALFIVPVLAYVAAGIANDLGVPGACGGFDPQMAALLGLVWSVPSGAAVTFVVLVAHGAGLTRRWWVFGLVVVYAVVAAGWIGLHSDWCT